MVSGDALRRKNEAGPAQRQAAHSASSTTAEGGPQPNHDFRGRTSTPDGVPTSSPTTQPRTVRPWKGARTRDPMWTSSRQPAGTA